MQQFRNGGRRVGYQHKQLGNHASVESIKCIFFQEKLTIEK